MRRFLATVSLFFLGAVMALNVEADAPAVTVTYPPVNAIIDEARTPTIVLQASATDPDEPSITVRFYVCPNPCTAMATMVGSVGSPPYQLPWTPDRVVPGQGILTLPYLVWAQASNNLGQTRQSSNVAFTWIQPPPPPSVTLVAPTLESGYVTPTSPVLYATAFPGSTVPASTIASVDFLDGATVIGSVSAPNAVPAGYAFIWQNAPQGIHLIAARATDSLGYSVTSSPVTVYIVGPDPAPQVTLASPTTGQIFAPPNAVPLAASASSSLGIVERVEFIAADRVIATALSPPYTATWTNPPPGTFAVVARAYDDVGFAATSQAAYIQTLASPRRPSVVLTAPAPGSTVPSGTPLPMAVTALAPDGSVGRVDFYADAVLVGSASTAPYQFTWNNPSSGAHSLAAWAYDLLGNVRASAPVAVTVINNRPPTVALTSPANGAQFTAPATIALAATAADPDGTVSKVEFFAGAIKVATATTSPYSASWSNVGAGSYTLTAVATDNLGTTAMSAAVSVSVAAPPLTIALTAPPNSARYAVGQPIVLTAQANAPQRSIARVEFYSDGSLIGTTSVNGGPSAITVNFAWNNAATGLHALSANVIAIDAASATSASVSVTVVDLTVTLSEPFSGQVYQAPGDIRISANPAETNGTIARVDFYGDGALIGSAPSAPWSFVWRSVAAGSHTVRAEARDSSGLVATSATLDVTVVSAPTLQVDPGIDGSTVADDNVSISGTVQAAANSAVTVNGRSAALDSGGRFVIDNVGLQPGANALTLVLNGLDGAQVTRSINVGSSGSAPFAVFLDKQEGFAPLTVDLTITNRGHVPFQRIEVDWNGDSIADTTLTTLQNDKTQTAVTYNNPGTYPIGVKVFDANNALIYTAARTVRVYSKAELGLKLVGAYVRMVDKLAGNDAAGALRSFTAEAQTRYRAVFDALGALLPSVANQLRTIIDGVVTEDTAELTILENTASGQEAFMIYLIRGGDGIWRIESM